MSYKDDQISNLTFNIKKNFPELKNSIENLREEIRIANLIEVIKLNQQHPFLSEEEKNDLLGQISEKYLTKSKRYTKKQGLHW